MFLLESIQAKKSPIVIGLVLSFCLTSFQISPALAMERLPWKINIPKSKNTVIQGKVVEQINPSSQKPIFGALVEVFVFPGGSIPSGSGKTNGSGDYSISGKLNGDFYIKVSRTDYETQTTQKESFKTGNTYKRSFVLKRKPPRDTIPPITTDSGIDGLWHNQAVTVVLKAQDNLSGIDKTYYSLDGSTPRIVYQGGIVVSKQGIYPLRYYSKDKAGNVERVKTASRQIKIDKTPPQGSIEINNNAPCTNNLQVNLRFPTAKDSGGSSLSQMQFYNQGDIDPTPAGDSNWTTPEAYSISKDLTLPAGDGQKKIFVRFKDTAGNWSAPLSASIVLDTTAPRGTVTINNGEQYTANPRVNLCLSIVDDNCLMEETGEMQFSYDNQTWSVPERYTCLKQWEFSTGDGEKTVYAKFSDALGNWSPPITAAIILDTSSPTVKFLSPLEGSIITGRDE